MPHEDSHSPATAWTSCPKSALCRHCSSPEFHRHQCWTIPPTATHNSKLPDGPVSLVMPYCPWIMTGPVSQPAPNTSPSFQVRVGSSRQKCCIVPSVRVATHSRLPCGAPKLPC